jgi:hypothetical protein
MNDALDTSGMTEHREISALIPWYVNDTIDEGSRKRVDAHLSRCAACRADLHLERRVHGTMTADSGVEYMAGPSLKRLSARLDGLDARHDVANAASSSAAQPVGREMPWRSLLAASVAMIAIALGLIAAEKLPGPVAPHDYYTVTTPVPRAPNELVRAVFAPTITLVELQAILDEAQLRIVSGPTEAGVYSLAAGSNRPVSASLALLRRHEAVRFAERIPPADAPDRPQ